MQIKTGNEEAGDNIRKRQENITKISENIYLCFLKIDIETKDMDLSIYLNGKEIDISIYNMQFYSSYSTMISFLLLIKLEIIGIFILTSCLVITGRFNSVFWYLTFFCFFISQSKINSLYFLTLK